MDSFMHGMPELFAQLGLGFDDTAIDRFVATHGPLPSDMALSEAPFWSLGQAEFLREGTLVDADWAAAIDTLNTCLRARWH